VLGYKSAEWSDNKAVKTFGPSGIAIATSILQKISAQKVLDQFLPKEMMVLIHETEERWNKRNDCSRSAKEMGRCPSRIQYKHETSLARRQLRNMCVLPAAISIRH